MSSRRKRRHLPFQGARAIANKLSRKRGTKNSGYPIQDMIRTTRLVGPKCVWQNALQDNP